MKSSVGRPAECVLLCFFDDSHKISAAAHQTAPLLTALMVCVGVRVCVRAFVRVACFRTFCGGEKANRTEADLQENSTLCKQKPGDG